MNELCQAENTVAQRSNHSEVGGIIVEDGKNAASGTGAILTFPEDKQAQKRVTEQEQDRQNCGVLSNGPVFDARRNSPNVDAGGKSPDLDQKKLLCGSKRLFN